MTGCDRLYRALALFDTRDRSERANIVRAAGEGYERSDLEMDEPNAWDEFDCLIFEYNLQRGDRRA